MKNLEEKQIKLFYLLTAFLFIYQPVFAGENWSFRSRERVFYIEEGDSIQSARIIREIANSEQTEYQIRLENGDEVTVDSQYLVKGTGCVGRSLCVTNYVYTTDPIQRTRIAGRTVDDNIVLILPSGNSEIIDPEDVAITSGCLNDFCVNQRVHILGDADFVTIRGLFNDGSIIIQGSSAGGDMYINAGQFER